MGVPFENPNTGQEFADWDDCVSTVSSWEGVSAADAEAMCGAWQAATKGNVLRYNAADPTQSARIRKNWQDELERRLDTVAEQVATWFETNEIRLQDIRLRFTQWLRTRLFEQVLTQQPDAEISNGRHWTATYMREAYRRGVGLARTDLQAFDTYTSFRIQQATQIRKEAHQQHLTREYVQAYTGLRDQMFRAVDQIGATIRELVSAEAAASEFESAVRDHIQSEMQTAARAHANTVVVDAVNEALLTTFEQIGVPSVGVAPESDTQTVNMIRVNDLPDPDDVTAPDEVQWVTAGDDAVCPTCAALEGTVLDIADVRGRDQFMPPVHINCRCRLVPLPP